MERISANFGGDGGAGFGIDESFAPSVGNFYTGASIWWDGAGNLQNVFDFPSHGDFTMARLSAAFGLGDRACGARAQGDLIVAW